MPSQRKYPPRICKSRYCRLTFIPHDARQEFCVPQCRINENNDKRSDVDKPFNEDRKKIKNNDKVLSLAYKKMIIEKQEFINKDFLEFAGYDFSTYFNTSKNKLTSNTIFWNIKYGIEPANKQMLLFVIHKL